MKEIKEDPRAAASLLLAREIFGFHNPETARRLHRFQRSNITPMRLSRNRDALLEGVLRNSQKSSSLVVLADLAICSLRFLPRDEEIFRMCFGWDGVRRTMVEIGRVHGLKSGSRVGVIRGKGVGLLRGADYNNRNHDDRHLMRIRTESPIIHDVVSSIRLLLPDSFH